jgi:hypothetical protein
MTLELFFSPCLPLQTLYRLKNTSSHPIGEQQYSMENNAPKSMRRLRLFSLDGGGVRGLSSIMILKDIMKALNYGLEQPLEPWQVFDMIGGKSFQTITEFQNCNIYYRH